MQKKKKIKKKSNDPALEDMIEKATRVLLTMQRHAWEQGVAAQAFLELRKTDLLILMAKEAVLRQNEDGRLGDTGLPHAVCDPAANGEAVLYAAKVTEDPGLRKSAERMLNFLQYTAPRTKDNILFHLTDKRQVWIDSMYMAPPFLAVAGCPGEAVKQITGMRKLLWNPEKKLYSHIWDEVTGSLRREDFWGVGNGWAAAGITRVIRNLHLEMHEEKKTLIKWVKEGIDGCLNFKRSDNLFHNIIDDSKTFTETNLSQMLAYSIYRGVQGEWLDASYLEHANLMRKAVHKKVDDYGYVRDVCGAPNFDHPGTAPEGQAFFLLMEAALQDLERS